MPTYVEPTVDCVAKAILGSEEHKNILIHFLNAILELEGDKRVVEVDILNPFNEKDFEREKLTSVDVKARDQKGRIFQVDVQVVAHSGLAQRAVYYWSSIFSSQLIEKQNYTELKPVISIWLVVNPMFDLPKVHLPFTFHNRENNLDLTSVAQIHVLQLKFVDEDDKIKKDGEKWVWLKYFNEGGSIDLDNPPPWLNVDPMKEVQMIAKQFTSEETKRLQYLAKKDAIYERNTFFDAWQRDIANARADAQYAKEKAHQERAAKEQERAAKEQERAAKERFAAKLRELGVDPQTIDNSIIKPDHDVDY